jgi:hypothetical protein
MASSTSGCSACGRFDCVCAFLHDHEEHCAFHRSITCAVPIECGCGYDVCPKCDPCTCAPRAARGRLMSVLLARVQVQVDWVPSVGPSVHAALGRYVPGRSAAGP